MANQKHYISPKSRVWAIGPLRPYGQRGGKWLVWIFKLGISTLLLYLVAKNVDFARMGSLLTEARTGPVIIAFGIIAISQLIGAYRLTDIVHALQLPLRLFVALRFQFIGLFFNSALPSSVGGDAMRILLLFRAGFRLERAFGIIFIDRFAAVIAVIVIVGAAQPFYSDLLHSSVLSESIFIVLLIILLSSPILLVLEYLPARLLQFRLIRSLVRLVKDARIVLFSWRHGTRILLMSILIQFSVSIIFYYFAIALGVEMPLTTCIMLVPVVILVTIIPISIGGWGVRESATVTLFGSAGVDPEGALLVSILYGFTIMFTGIPGGILWLLDKKSLNER